MNVLLVTNMYPTESRPFYGTFVKEQVDSIRRENVKVDVCYICGKESKINYFYGLFKLLKLLRSNHYDIIHAHHTYCVFLASLAKRVSGKNIPLVLTFHEGEVHKSKKIHIGDVGIMQRLVFSKRLKSIALQLSNVNIFVEESLIASLNYKGKYWVLPCGVDTEQFSPRNRVDCRKSLGLPLDKKIIFFPASPSNVNKGYGIVTKALKLLDRADVMLVEAGNVEHMKMPIYMSAADVVVQPSEYEASPMVLKEAMAADIPVVFSDVGDARLTIGSAKGCFLCARTTEDVASKIQEALLCNGRSDGRSNVIRNGLSLDYIACQIVNIYRSPTK